MFSDEHVALSIGLILFVDAPRRGEMRTTPPPAPLFPLPSSSLARDSFILSNCEQRRTTLRGAAPQ